MSDKDRNKKAYKNKDKETKDMRKAVKHRRRDEMKAKSKDK